MSTAIFDETGKAIEENLPYLKQLMMSDKISITEKINVIEDVNIDIAAFLLSIGEEV